MFKVREFRLLDKFSSFSESQGLELFFHAPSAASRSFNPLVFIHGLKYIYESFHYGLGHTYHIGPFSINMFLINNLLLLEFKCNLEIYNCKIMLMFFFQNKVKC